jgi:uncharacterized protein YbcV (DUF1398 family)
MQQEHITVIQESASLSRSGKIPFAESVQRLMRIGVERYHADYSRQECTYYMPDGESLIVALPHESGEIAETFSAQAVEASVRQSQRGEIIYPQFVKQTQAAGCVGYFVQITGRQAIYFGRRGEIHLERFPAAKT